MGPIACIVIDGFLVAAERRLDPALRGRPLAVGGRTLVAVSTEARADGVEAGQSPAEARRRCPSLAIVPGSFEAHRSAVARIDAMLRAMGCRREWQALDELYLAAGHAERHDRHLCRAAEDLMANVAHELEFDASCGIATTRVAARAAARLGAPRGLVQVLPGYDARFLAALDIEWLEGIGPREAECLRTAGVSTIGALPSCDSRVAAAILGRTAPVLVQLATAHDDRTVLGVGRQQKAAPGRPAQAGLGDGVAPRSLADALRVAGAAR